MTNSADYMRKYRRSQSGAESILKYKDSDKARERNRRYLATEKGKATEKARRVKKIEQGRLLIDEAKDVPCADCGNRFARPCMEFHHLSDKQFSIARRAHFGINKLRREIAKCIVLCANCHRMRHIV